MNAFIRRIAGLLVSVAALSTVAAPAAAAPRPWAVTFMIDMRAEIAAKRFDPVKDGVGIRSGFPPLGWAVTTPALDPDADGIYEVTILFPERPFGGQPVAYKFKIERPGRPDDGWEEGRNRGVTLEAQSPVVFVQRRFDEPPTPVAPARTGTLRTHPAFPSRFLGPRDVIVYLPPGYEKDRERRYPVLYLHDGQNLFDAEHAGMEWQMDETAERLIRSGAIGPLIVVGIASTDARTDEYTPTAIEEKGDDGSVVRKGGGKADLYGKLLVEELKPFIDRTYRTRPERAATALGGASFGGLVSLYLGIQYPQVFGTILAVSPSVWWDNGVVLKKIAALPAKTGQRIWVDIGTGEGDEAVTGVQHLRDALTAKGWKAGADFASMEAEGAQHDELAWAARVEPMLKFVDGGIKK
jgi:predicted alpha/beta superfamily hydrolase